MPREFSTPASTGSVDRLVLVTEAARGADASGFSMWCSCCSCVEVDHQGPMNHRGGVETAIHGVCGSVSCCSICCFEADTQS